MEISVHCDIVWFYKGRERYLINAQKSVEVLLSLFKKLLDMEQVTLDDIPIPQESFIQCIWEWIEI